MDRTDPFKTTHMGPRLPLEEIYEPYFLHAFAKGSHRVQTFREGEMV